jgi:translation initiation factor 4B
MEGAEVTGRSWIGRTLKKDQDSRSAPEPKRSEEIPASKFSSASKYAALSVDGENADEGEDGTE